MPSVAPWPVVPIIVTAEICVAITDSPTAHHGRLRLARKYPSVLDVPFDRRMPCVTTYASHPMTMTQLSQCTLWRVGVLKEPEERERDHLHRHHADQRSAEAGAAVHGRIAGEPAAGRLAAVWRAASRLMNSRAAPGFPAGSCRKNESVV